MKIEIKPFRDENEKEWDDFIFNQSCNGTLLQSRRFLNYHKEGKYDDCSLMFYLKNELVAVCPACAVFENDKKVFSSHSGSTYGGFVVSRKTLRVEKILALIDEFEKCIISNGFKKCTLKQQNPLMCTEKMDLVEFCLCFRGYHEYKELDIFVDLIRLEEDNIIGSFSKLKKRLTKKCIEYGMKVVELKRRDELERFIDILADNLRKYDLKPYHSTDDLMDLKDRFPNEIEYWGCIYDDKIVAVAMCFLFEKADCVHTHYLAADPEYQKESPMTFIYYKMIEEYKVRGYTNLSWGITTEHNGVEINYNLTNTKEEFDGRHNVVSVYEKDF